MKKIIKTTIILMIFITLNNNILLAGTISTDDIWEVGKEFIDLGIRENNGETKIDTEAKKQFQFLIDFLWGIGLLVIFLSTVVLGIKYMLVPPGEKSKIKQATTPYIIGVIIIFGSVTIWKILIEILDGSL